MFVAEKGGRILVFDGIDDPTGAVVADLGERLQLLGPRDAGHGARPQLPGGSLHLRPLHLRRRARRHGAAMGSAANRRCRPLSRPARGRPADGCVVTGRLSRLDVGNAANWPLTTPEEPLITDWCQQFPSHSIGDAGVRRRRRAVCQRRRRGQLQLSPTTARRRPVESRGDPRGAATTTRPAEGGALRSQDVRTSGDPVDPRRRDHPHRPRHRRGAGRTTRREQRRHERRSASSPTASATRSDSPSAPAPASSGSATSAGARGRRSTASSTRPTPRSTTSAGRATRAIRSRAATLRFSICQGLYARAPAPPSCRTSPTTTSRS